MKTKKITNTRILITGATGFVGSHLTEELIKQGAQVTATTHHTINPKSYFATQKLGKNCRLVKIEVTNLKSVFKLITNNLQLTTNNHFDFIFHLAAQPLVEEAFIDPKTTLYSNIAGTINVLESARLNGKIQGIIIASSDKAYGKLRTKNLELRTEKQELRTMILKPRTKNFKYISSKFNVLSSKSKYSERDPLRGDHPYEVSKSSTDLISQAYYQSYGLPIVITRFGNIYGEGDIHFSRLIPGIMKSMVNNEVFDIRSNGQYIRDYLYVKDVVNGYLLLAQNMEKVRGEAFNFGSNDTYSVLSLISLISQITRKKINYRILNTARNEIPYQSLDWTKIQNVIGWKPEYSLSKTINDIYKWYERFFKS